MNNNNNNNLCYRNNFLIISAIKQLERKVIKKPANQIIEKLVGSSLMLLIGIPAFTQKPIRGSEKP